LKLKFKMHMWLAVFALFAVIAAACGDDDDTAAPAEAPAPAPTEAPAEAPAPASDPKADGIAAAQAFIDPLLEDPTDLEVGGALASPIEPGKTFFWAECNFPVCASIGDGIEEAGEAVGWDVVRVPYNPGNQDEVGSVMLQGVDSGADFIGITGRPLSEFEDAADLSIERGVPIFDAYTVNPVSFEENGIYSCLACQAFVDVSAAAVSNWVIVDSGGEATVLVSTINDFPFIAYFSSVIEQTYAANCPDCNIIFVEHSIQNLLEGAIPGRLIAAIQENQDAQPLYLQYTFGDQAFGATAAIEEAGLLDSVKIVGSDPSTENLRDLQAGKEAAWSGNPVNFVGWKYIDIAARFLQGEDISTLGITPPPTQILLPDSAAVQVALDVNAETGTSAPYVGVNGYQDIMKGLWGVG
jgi:hypothetical protein